MPECNKVKFASKEYAQFHIKKHEKKNIDQGLTARAYECRFCGSWHITSKILNSELILDNEALRGQLIDYIKENENLKAEVEFLKMNYKQFSSEKNSQSPEVRQLRETINKQRTRIKNQTDQLTQLLAKLNKQ